MTVIKILARHNPSYQSLIKYILTKEKNDKPQIFTHNLHSNNPAIAYKEFLQNESFRTNVRTDQIFLYHEIISFSDQDTKYISPEILEDIGRKYIELRGTEGMYFGAVHNDRGHTHIHFCTSGTKLYTGKAMRLARDELRQLKVYIQEYQKKYSELKHSVCDHGKGRHYTKTKEWHQNNRNEMKTTITKTVTECLEKANTQKEFLELLRENNLYHYERNHGELSGIVVENNKFRFTGLGIDVDRLKTLPLDLTEEQKALKEIQEIREQREEKSTNRVLQFEENGNYKAISFSLDKKEIYERDANGNENWKESELTPDELEDFERMNAVMEEYADRFESDDPEIENDDLDIVDTDDKDIDDEIDLEDEMDIDSDDDFDR